MILAMTPYAEDMNLGRAYNEAMALLPPDGWAVFLDHDAAWTTKDWYRQIVEAIRFKPEAGAFTACTNRIYSAWQRAGNPDNHDMMEQRRFGAERARVRTLLDATDTNGMGGVVMVVSKRAWERAGGFVDGLLCVDHNFHFAVRRAGLRVWLIEGLYVYHWRRADGDRWQTAAPRAECPCRGPEATPTRRERIA